jgi:CSLREA domain-containing protein
LTVGTAGAPPSARAEALFTVNRKGDASDIKPGNGKCDSSTASGRQCTLRAAIQEANAFPGGDSIHFNITATPRIIAPTSPLPAITERVAINGWSQPGTEENTLIVGNDAVFKITLDGINAGFSANGLELTGANTNVFGLVIQRFSGSGILITGTKNNVFGNFIGTNVAGTLARGNGVGVAITGDQNTVGGGFPSRRNLISGNTSHGVVISNSAAFGNTVFNSYIGTNRNGTGDLGNAGAGVLAFGANNNTVGVGSVSDRNVISGNGQGGIAFNGAISSSIVGNLIGTDASGTQPLPNDSHGIHLTSGSNSNNIGGAIAQLRNVVSGNHGTGIFISASNGNTVRGNRVGTKADGSGSLGNGETGISVAGSNNTIGGAEAADANVVATNARGGIAIFGVNAANNVVRGNSVIGNISDGIDVSEGPNTVTRNNIVGNTGHGVQVRLTTQARITENLIFGNAMLGIDLHDSADPANGVTPNDANDPDAGANGLQNFPVILSAVRSNATGLTTITMSLDSAPSTQHTVEVYMAAGDASGHGEAQVFLASTTITTNASGDKTFAVQTAALGQGHPVTATATSTTAGNTSEFAANRTVTVGP